MKPTRIIGRKPKTTPRGHKLFTCNNGKDYKLQEILDMVGITYSVLYQRIKKHGLSSPEVMKRKRNSLPLDTMETRVCASPYCGKTFSVERFRNKKFCEPACAKAARQDYEASEEFKMLSDVPRDFMLDHVTSTSHWGQI